MAIGSFVDGVFRGMSMRDTMDNNKRLRKMEDTRFEREGEKHGWDKEKHDFAMTRARRARTPSRADDFSTFMDGYSIAPAAAEVGGSVDYGAGNGSPAPLTSFPQSNVPAGQTLRTGPLQTMPRQMSINDAIPASAQPQQVASTAPASQGAVIEYDLIPGQGLVARAQSLNNRGLA